jgi:hypothetical protein
MKCFRQELQLRAQRSLFPKRLWKLEKVRRSKDLQNYRRPHRRFPCQEVLKKGGKEPTVRIHRGKLRNPISRWISGSCTGVKP